MGKTFSFIGKRKILDKLPPTLLFYRLVKQSSKTAEVAQLVEQRPEKPRVRSSILRLGTILPIFSSVTTDELRTTIRNKTNSFAADSHG
jgi:hypothetical protein